MGQELTIVISWLPLGVPPGTMLGPILSNLYLNDITEPGCNKKITAYGDDTGLIFLDTGKCVIKCLQ